MDFFFDDKFIYKIVCFFEVNILWVFFIQINCLFLYWGSDVIGIYCILSCFNISPTIHDVSGGSQVSMSDLFFEYIYLFSINTCSYLLWLEYLCYQVFITLSFCFLFFFDILELILIYFQSFTVYQSIAHKNILYSNYIWNILNLFCVTSKIKNILYWSYAYSRL